MGREYVQSYMWEEKDVFVIQNLLKLKYKNTNNPINAQVFWINPTPKKIYSQHN